MSEQNLITFDADFALSQFSGNQSLLIQILAKYVDQNNDFAAQLTSSLQQGDIDTAKRQVHTLKGVTGNLGMKALNHACKKVEDEIEQHSANIQLDDFFKLIDATVLIAKNYGVKPELPVEPITPAQSQPASTQSSEKEQFITALRRNEFFSDAKLEQYINAAGLSAQETEKLKLYIDNFDYASAISMLD